MPLFLFLKSEFMVALAGGGRGARSRRRAGYRAAAGPARTEGRAAGAGERAAAREPLVRRGSGSPSLPAGGGAPASHWLSGPLPRRWRLPSRRGGSGWAGLPGASGERPWPRGVSGAPGWGYGWGHRTLERLGWRAGALWPLSQARPAPSSPPTPGLARLLAEGCHLAPRCPSWASGLPSLRLTTPRQVWQRSDGSLCSG